MRRAISVLIALALFSPWVQSAESRLSISAAISGIESSMLRECVQRNVSGLSFADELTRLECREESDSDNIDSLAGLEQFSGLTVLYIEWGKLSDVSPIGELIKLEQLVLDNGDYGQDFSSLTSLINLQSLRIAIETGDLDWLTSLSTLSELHLTAFLPGGGEPTLDLNKLAGLINLEILGIYHGRYSDLAPIANLQKLKWLRFGNADVQNWEPITSLQMLEELWVYARSYHFDLSVLNEFPLLNTAQIATSYEGILEDLIELPTNLVHFGIWYSNVTDFSWVSRLTKLKTLHLGGNEETKILDLSDLASIDYLESLDLWYGNVQKLGTAFDTWRNGTVIQATGNPLTCADLASARENASITIIFDSECSPSSDSGSDGVEGTVDDFSYRHPDRDYAIYYYRLTDQPKKYPYDLGGGTYQVTVFGGGAPTDFYTYVDGSPILFETLNNENNETSVPYDVEEITEVWGASSGYLELSTASLTTAHCFRVESDDDKAVVCLFEDVGRRAADIVQKSSYLKVTRPTLGSVSGWSDICSHPDFDGFSDQIERNGQVGLFFSNRILGGTGPFLEYSPGENAFIMCPDTPPGIYPLEVVALDGVGGKKKFDLTVEITEEQVDGGKVEWFPLGTLPGDMDGDGIADDIDAFPNDPAAAIDTDGDGKPDDWNEGKSEADSTSDPVLVLDDDDDDDGYLDVEDDFPLDDSKNLRVTNQIDDCVSGYCAVVSGRAQYVYSLQSEFREYRFQHDLELTGVRWGGGQNTYAFDYIDEQGVQTWSVNTETGGSQAIDDSFIGFKEALIWSKGRIQLRANEDFQGGGYEFIDLLTNQGVIRVTLSAAPIEDIEALQIEKAAVRFTPPAEGTGASQTFGDNCAVYDSNTLFGRTIREGGSFLLERYVSGSQQWQDVFRPQLNWWTVCSDAPVGSFDTRLVYLDGLGKKKTFDFSIKFNSERVSGGRAEWLEARAELYQGAGCDSAYCVLTETGSHHYFALTSKFERYPFTEGAVFSVDGVSGGAWQNGWFEFGDEGEEVVFDPEQSEPSASALQAYLNEADGTLSLRGRSGEGRLESNDPAASISIGMGNKSDLVRINQQFSVLEITRPAQGAGNLPGNECSVFPIGEIAKPQGIFVDEPQISEFVSGGIALVPLKSSDSALALDLFNPSYQGTKNLLRACADTATGIWDFELAALDGRGGQFLMPLRVKVLESRSGEGGLNWSNATAMDRDSDGVDDDIDAFPDDPAASIDTDGDGKPDDWNEGKSEADSTSDPVLVLDDDDDGDGLIDSLDNCPFVANKDQLDTDVDFLGNVCDSDDDNDSLPDEIESLTLRNPLLADYGVATWKSFSCAITDNGVECWGNGGNDKLNAPALNRPRKIGVGFQHACVLDEVPEGNEVVCWGWNGNGETEVPELSNPFELSVGSQSSCAIDDTGVKCWGWGANGETAVPELINPTKLASGEQNHCALHDGGVSCWGFNANGESSPPADLSEVSVFDAGVFSGCAANKSGARCWGFLAEEEIPTLDRPFAIGVGINFACALDRSGLNCWGPRNVYQQQNAPLLKQPVQLSVGEDQVCVLDDFGFHCWGRNDDGQVDVPTNLLIDADFDGVTSQGGLDPQPFDVLDTDRDGLADLFDNDDDGDGVADEADFYPMDASRSVAQFGDALDLISDAGLRSCIQNQFSSLAATDSVLSVTQLNCARAGISLLDGLEVFIGLEVLELPSNPIQDLTPIASLKKLLELRLGETGPYVGLPVKDFSVLGALVELQSLEIGWVASQGASLGDADWIGSLTKLRYLNLRGMGLTSLRFLEQLPSLQQLWVSHSSPLNLTPLLSTPALITLGVDGLGLESLTEIPTLNSLEDLDVRSNELIDLVGIERFPSLKVLTADENLISDLQALSKAPQLEQISLVSNNISSPGAVLLNWNTPLSLALTDNPISCFSLDQLSQKENITLAFDSECVQSEDSDDDGLPDASDAFPADPAASVDTDGDGKPDDWNEGKSAEDSTSDPALVLDDDDDGDGVVDTEDAYPLDPERSIFDEDSDGIADGLDNCPNVANNDQFDLDDDQIGDACDDDIDGDDCPNIEDAYPSDRRRCEVGVQKAIVVAGGGPYPANFLWEATERMAELSIKTLKAQGIKDENILYLSAGFGDQFSPQGPATAASVQEGIVNWTLENGAPADDVLLYLVDHGGREVFELAKKSLLPAQDLDVWLDELQQGLPGQLTVVYDACQSGSFVPVLAPTEGQERLIIASSGPEERAHFASKGDVSFSFHFWSNFLIGGDLYRAFSASENAITAIFNRKQTAEIEVDGDGLPNRKADKSLARAFSFGQGIALASDVPVVGAVSDTIILNGETEVTLEAFNVAGASEVVRVWALIDTPDQIELPIDEPLTNIATIEFEDPDGDGHWQAVFSDATILGTYELQVFAQNVGGQYSIPPIDGSNKITVVQRLGRAPLVGRDSDQDGVLDQSDAFPLDPRYQTDSDRDLIPDQEDPDADNDGERDAYQGKDIFEVPQDWQVHGYLLQDGDELYGTFHGDDDVDRYAIFGLKGEELTLTVYAAADAVNGPDLILSVVDEDGVVQIADNKKLLADLNLKGGQETLTFIVPETGKYLVEVSQDRLLGDQYVLGAQSEYALLAQSDREGYAFEDVESVMDGLGDRAEALAWSQTIGVEGAAAASFQGEWHLMLPPDVSAIGAVSEQCDFSRSVLTCVSNNTASIQLQLLAEVAGVRELALYSVQLDESGARLKETEAKNNLRVVRFLVSEDIDQDSLPDDYERKRGLIVGVDDSLDDIDGDGVSNIDEYLGGLNPLDLSLDADLDGVPDDIDAFPDDPTEWLDTDGDLLGNNLDDDDDGDGTPDAVELIDGTDPLDRFSCKSGCVSLDVDDDLETRALTDGLLVIRFLFGFEGDALVTGATGQSAGRADAGSLLSYLQTVRDGYDVDGDGETRALTDGLLIIRRLFGFEGSALTAGALGSNATRTDAVVIANYIDGLKP
jgi:hypothetical protein